MQISNSTCNSLHGLPSTLSWPHKYSLCEFIERISQQRNNLANLEKLIIEAKMIKQQVDINIFGTYSRCFSHKHQIKLNDISKLMDRAIKKMRTRNEPKKNWNAEEISILIWIVHQYQHFFQNQFYYLSRQNWESISSYVPGKTPNECLFRMLKFQKSNLSQYPWTKQEQVCLRQLVGNQQNKDWNKISQDLYFQSNTPRIYRLPKQCREHWSSYMIHQLKKGPWSSSQDIVLLESVKKMGKKWTQIAKQLLGRTQNAIKNRCNLLLSKHQNELQQTHFNKKLDKIIQKIKQDIQLRSSKINSKPKRQRKRRQQDSNINIQQSLDQNISEAKMQNNEQNKSINDIQSQNENSIEIEDQISKNNDALKTRTHLQNPVINNSFQQLSNYQPEDVGHFLFIQQFQQLSSEFNFLPLLN